jgi:hypothetical protein
MFVSRVAARSRAGFIKLSNALQAVDLFIASRAIYFCPACITFA